MDAQVYIPATSHTAEYDVISFMRILKTATGPRSTVFLRNKQCTYTGRTARSARARSAVLSFRI